MAATRRTAARDVCHATSFEIQDSRAACMTKRCFEQRGDGRGRGGRTDGQNDGRGRERVQRPAAAVPHGDATAVGQNSQMLPPGIPQGSKVVLPPVEVKAAASPAANTHVEASGIGWRPTGLSSEMLQISQLNISKPDSRLSPTLDPVAPPKGTDSR